MLMVNCLLKCLQVTDLIYMGKYDKNAANGEAAFKLYNFVVNAQPKSCIVSFYLLFQVT